MKEAKTAETENRSATQLEEGVDYYFDGGLMVLTARFLRERGYCCDNGCRHCPYESGEKFTSK
ncbi:MAG: DUF5522 domain-containing protein [Acidobacteriota bacterium]|nr:DUF5522 domain-containing protein [Acidobacteriota bacterium]